MKGFQSEDLVGERSMRYVAPKTPLTKLHKDTEYPTSRLTELMHLPMLTHEGEGRGDQTFGWDFDIFSKTKNMQIPIQGTK